MSILCNLKAYVKTCFLHSALVASMVWLPSPVSAAYCAANMSNPFATMGITNVTIGSINNNTSSNWATATGSTGYINNTSLSTGSMPRGSATAMSYTITTPGFQSFTVGVFFDWNGDTDFADAGETVQTASESSPAGTSFTYNFNVTPPVGATIGDTRFRIVNYYGTTTAALACPPQTTQIGETQDYTANIATGLPIELIYFDAYKDNDKKVALTWDTNAEINNDYFTVERSTDGINFYPILTLPGAGNSTRPIVYAAFDESPANGWNYYRLKQTDYDGQYAYSVVKAALIAKSKTNCTVYNTPYNALHIHVTNEKKEVVLLGVYDIIGQQVYATYLEVKNYAVNAVVDMDTVGSVGVYFVKVSEGNNQCMAKVYKY